MHLANLCLDELCPELPIDPTLVRFISIHIISRSRFGLVGGVPTRDPKVMGLNHQRVFFKEKIAIMKACVCLDVVQTVPIEIFKDLCSERISAMLGYHSDEPYCCTQ